ncbi:hypothetical protein CFT61_07825 [Segatella copri]|uniref:Minor fimbrium subunit Mfa1 C-terminal domain-containing protein n=1 Tax=Segatella copri TaxID=165179 RepID=A0AA91YX46_9BACT|nr:Mfa1 family fimbria major subunit [Segatella copri]OXL44023.1 hypothetical protein CFT61_07825 [Segatella copri]
MKKMNLLVMSLVSAAALSFSSCSSNDDLTGGGTQSQADGVYMTLKISGATSHGTRTGVATPNTEENGTVDESTITEGMMYIYDGNTCVFKKVITKDMFKTPPTQTAAGVTNPIKVAVTGAIKTNKPYNVYFLANNTSINDPLAAEAIFTASTTGGANYATAKKFVMFNQNDGTRAAAHSTVTFTDAAKSADTPAPADEIKLDRVVARIDNPLFAETAKVVDDAAAGTTTNVAKVVASFDLMGYAASNLNNNSYVKQNWDTEFKTLNVKWGETAPKYFQPKSDFGTLYKAENLTKFGTNNTYAFENTTNDVNEATAVYFKIKANLTDAEKAKADFDNGTFYRYDGRLYTSIKAIFDDAATGAIVNPFNLLTVDQVLAKIKDATTGELTTEEELAKFRETYKIEVYREGMMYYRWAISDNVYKPFVESATTHTYSVLRNSIYRLNVTKINEIGKDVPNGPDPDDPNKNPNYYMNVTVKINPWVLNTKDIELK